MELNSIDRIIDSFNNTLIKSKLTDVAEELTENIIDNKVSNSIVREIPIINTLIGIIQSTQNISNYLFLRKITAFISKIKDISPQQRSEVIGRIDASNKYREKVGITLLSIIDKCESAEKTEYIAILFRAFLKGNIEYDCFKYATHIIQRSYYNDFKEFVLSDDNWMMIEDSMDYINAGLYTLDITHILTEYKRELRGESYYENLGEVGAVISDIGKTLRLIFQEAYDEGLIN